MGMKKTGAWIPLCIALNERLDDDGFPHYEADVESMWLL